MNSKIDEKLSVRLMANGSRHKDSAAKAKFYHRLVLNTSLHKQIRTAR
jgi:hypothetical protein